MGRLLGFLYGIVAYLVFFASFLYAIGFVGAIAVPKTIDNGAAVSLTEALVIDILLMSLFAIQHSVMARPQFKAWWTRFVPKPVERSTYVLLASLCLVLLFWQWRPIPAARSAQLLPRSPDIRQMASLDSRRNSTGPPVPPRRNP